MKLLFVCLGNICRSPAAESIANQMLEELSISAHCDSAGITGYHSGESADSRMRAALQRRGYKCLSRSRQVISDDFMEFDYIIAMDHSNYQNLLSQAPNQHPAKIIKMCDYSSDSAVKEVPDPYYGGEDGFFRVIDILEDSMKNFLKSLT